MSAAKAEESAPTERAPAAKLLSPGDMIDGRYRIESYLGGGGMASVYRATHVVLEQAVAIKVISPAIRELPGMAQRFLREARAATHLKSEHVARVSDVGTMADGAPYMVMEFLDGRDLDAVLEASEPVPVEDAVDYVLQACEALAEVHGLGIVHRDLKPANLFLTRGADGLPCVKLIDFGISRTDSPLQSKDLSSLTQPDTVMGSPRYMSPEQMESAAKADARSDIYGTGAVLYELLTRKAPHEGETFLDIYAAATLGPAVPPSEHRPDVPKELDEVILRCLRIDPAERYVDVADLAAALAPFGPAGSTARAEAIARVLDAARLRNRDGSTAEESLSGGEDSRVRRRVPSSAHSVRKRRARRGGAVLAVIALAGLVFGGRALYTQGHASGMASIATTAPIAVPPPPPSTVASPTGVINVGDVVDPSSAGAASTTETTGAQAASANVNANANGNAKAPSTATPRAPAGAPVAAPRTAPVAAPRTAPVAAPHTAAVAPVQPVVPAPTAVRPTNSTPPSDERKLFEDRK